MRFSESGRRRLGLAKREPSGHGFRVYVPTQRAFPPTEILNPAMRLFRSYRRLHLTFLRPLVFLIVIPKRTILSESRELSSCATLTAHLQEPSGQSSSNANIKRLADPVIHEL